MLKAMENETVFRARLGLRSQTFGIPDGQLPPVWVCSAVLGLIGAADCWICADTSHDSRGRVDTGEFLVRLNAQEAVDGSTSESSVLLIAS